MDQGSSGGGDEKQLDPGCSTVKVNETEVMKGPSHLQELSGPGFDPYSDPRAQSSLEVPLCNRVINHKAPL